MNNKKLTVSALIKELQDIQTERGDLEIVTSIDDEGNGFRQLRRRDVDLTRFKDGDIYIIHLTEELREQGYCEEDYNPDAPIVVCLG